MKIDVEGWEENVLQGAAKLLSSFPPKAIVFEANCDRSGTILNGNLPSLLANYGYEIDHISRSSSQMNGDPRPSNSYVENFIAVLGT